VRPGPTNGDYLLNTEQKPLLMPFHDAAILSCSLCHRKPLIATCAVDNLDNSLEIVKEFTENVYSVSVHPFPRLRHSAGSRRTR
jgi:hypothetical protein